MMTPTLLVAYLVLFATVGFLFIFASLLIGRFARANVPTPEKLETYECGEPTIGSSFVQFDLRFYVVALLFIIFDVEVAFFFPWAVVYGKATSLMSRETPRVAELAPTELTPEARQSLHELGVSEPKLPLPTAGIHENDETIQASARHLATMAIADMAVFFGVLLVGFAYVWYRGDLDWVRAVGTRTDEVEELPMEAGLRHAAETMATSARAG